MPVVLVGIDLVAVVLALVALGLALAIQQGLLKPLAAGLRRLSVAGIHFGSPLAGWLEEGGNAMVRGIEHWLAWQLREIVRLWHGIAAFVKAHMTALEDLALALDPALVLLRHVVIPRLLHAALVLPLRLAHAAEREAKHALAVATRVEHVLTGKLNHWVSHFTRTVEQPWLAFRGRVWPQAKADLDYVYGAAVAAEHAVAVELPRLPALGVDELERLLGKVPWKTTAGLLASIPLARWLVRALARETGLDRAECRGKVKGICGTNGRAWGDLLALATDFLVLTDMCAIIPPLEEGFHLVGGPLIGLLTDVGAGLCGPGSHPPAPLRVPALHLPPAPAVDLHLAA